MTLELYQEVALTRDLPEYELKARDVATLVDFVSHPHNGEEGCLLKVFNAIGESLTVISVPLAAVEALRAVLKTPLNGGYPRTGVSAVLKSFLNGGYPRTELFADEILTVRPLVTKSTDSY